MRVLSLLWAATAFAAQGAFSLRIPTRAQPVARRSSALHPIRSTGALSRATSNTTTSNGVGFTSFLTNSNDILYIVNITLGGSPFLLQLDTGSTDLALIPDRPIQTSLVIDDNPPNSSYASGYIAGPVAFAKLEFGPYTIDAQAFINGTSETFIDQFYYPRGVRGIMGVDFDVNTISSVRGSLNQGYPAEEVVSMGGSVLSNIFAQQPELGNFTTIYLGRTRDGEATGEGIFTVGEYVEGTEDDLQHVESMDVFSFAEGEGLVYWALPMDGLIVNGQSISVNSSLPNAPSGKAIAVLDSGTSQAFVPDYIRDAMYSAYEGAYSVNGSLVLPCLNDAANVSFVFGGEDFYIHPIDLTEVIDLRTSGYNLTVCVPTFNGSAPQGLDLLLGDSFMRNVYTAFDYGSVSPAGEAKKTPSVKMRSISSSVVDFADYQFYRRKNLASLPPEATKEQLEKITSQIPLATLVLNNNLAVSDTAESPGATNVHAVANSPHVASEAPVATSHVANNLDISSASVSSSGDNSYSALIDKLNTYEHVVVGLLGAIIVALAGLMAVGVAACIRRGRSVGAPRSTNPAYAPVPVRFKKPEEGRSEEEMPSLGYRD
ncbi:unnamed protein product [Peniophora sp. CBMAI 1063]|nr:unnamed protein product [Peniophora sp. CBMAI 1063]